MGTLQSRHRSGASFRGFAAILLTGAILSCSSSIQHFDRIAEGLALDSRQIRGTEFVHQVYLNRHATPSSSLHLYLEGDGLPWRTPTTVSEDPTPRSPLVLGLLAKDQTPAFYLGRPCYHGLIQPPCTPLLWTHERYSEQVVTSLEAAIRQIMTERNAADLAIFGYSGGGALAMLLAERLEATRAVVTVAANLDIDAWTDHHDFTRLEGSLNPTRRPPLSRAIRQLHLAGGRDREVPSALVEAALRHQHDAELRIFPEFDHSCCWSQIWPRILAWVETE